jgi:hypothetical protein
MGVRIIVTIEDTETTDRLELARGARGHRYHPGCAVLMDPIAAFLLGILIGIAITIAGIGALAALVRKNRK